MFNPFKRRRPVVALDFDGTLLPTYEQIAKWHDTTYGTDFAPFNPSRWPDQRLISLWGDDATAKAAEFYRQAYAYQAQPIEGSREVLREFGDTVEFVVITSGSITEKREKKRWLASYFPAIKQIGFIDDGQTKLKLCHKFNADIMIEDRYDYAAGCAAGGIDAIILDRYRWSSGPETANIAHARDWGEVGDRIQQVLEARGLLKLYDSPAPSE